MYRQIDEVIVEWDISKDKLNIKKHGISFETAAMIFADCNRVEFYDSIHSTVEDRYIVIGLVNNLLTVVYTERSEALRLISARIATSAEREIYYGRNRKNNNQKRGKA